jgi:Spy/CpxP family protein refolding chaperone
MGYRTAIWSLMLVAATLIGTVHAGEADHGAMGGEMMGEMTGDMEEMRAEMHGMHAMPQDGGMAPMRMMARMRQLDLTPEQRRTLEQIHLQHQREAVPILGRVRTAEIEVRELLLDEPAALDKVNAKLRDKHAALAELELAHLALTQRLRAALTPEQRQQLDRPGAHAPQAGKAAPRREHAPIPQGPHGR